MTDDSFFKVIVDARDCDARRAICALSPSMCPLFARSRTSWATSAANVKGDFFDRDFLL